MRLRHCGCAACVGVLSGSAVRRRDTSLPTRPVLSLTPPTALLSPTPVAPPRELPRRAARWHTPACDHPHPPLTSGPRHPSCIPACPLFRPFSYSTPVRSRSSAPPRSPERVVLGFGELHVVRLLLGSHRLAQHWRGDAKNAASGRRQGLQAGTGRAAPLIGEAHARHEARRMRCQRCLHPALAERAAGAHLKPAPHCFAAQPFPLVCMVIPPHGLHAAPCALAVVQSGPPVSLSGVVKTKVGRGSPSSPSAVYR